jgi:hypothetical protein
MAYYATIRDDTGRTCYAAGPFNRAGDAANTVGHVRRHVQTKGYNDAHWMSYGTCRVARGRLPKGKFNAEIGLPTSGRIASLEIPGSRW